MKIDRVITSAVILLVTFLMVFFLVSPEYKVFRNLQTELGKKKAEFNAQFDYYAEITKIHNELQVHQDDIKKIDDALPQESSLGRLVYFFQKIAKDNGMMLRSVSLTGSSVSNAKENTDGSVRDIAFSLNLIGNYESLEKFMVSLEKSARIFEVTNISFGSSSASAPDSSKSQFQIQQTYAFNLQIKTHSY